MKKLIEEYLGDLLRKEQLTLATAESCTGGLIGHLLTNVPGSSDYYLGGAQVYSNDAKQKMLGVRLETLEAHGAVSQETVLEMATGIRKTLNSDVSIAVSGIAGPGGWKRGKPVGLVWIGITAPDLHQAWKNNWTGNRQQIKQQAAIEALALLSNYLAGNEVLQSDQRSKEKFSESGNPVEVWANFDNNGDITPTRFSFRGVKQQIDSVGRQWEKEGAIHFLVMVPIDQVYELIFDQQDMRWYLIDPKKRHFTA